jgi:protein FAM32A
LGEKVEKAARKSHKERVAELNRKLEEMTEHYDIPKVNSLCNIIRNY